MANSNAESESEVENVGNAYGFEAMAEPVEDETKKRKREESEESKALKKEIIKLVARYPSLEIRTSRVVMEKLNNMDEDELRIVRDNCISDLTELRGTPVSSFVLFCITQPVDWKLPGYTDQCMSDLELKRDIESEIIALMGDLSNRVNIFFRLINNAYITWKKSKGETFAFDAPTAKPQSNEQSDESDTKREESRTAYFKEATSGKQNG